MRLNTIKPGKGARKNKHRVGRGIGCGNGKTCGRGHKGQTSRSGGKIPAGFEGGQMPMARRVPKFGFTSRKAMVRAEVRLHELNKLADGVADLASLKAADIITNNIETVKIIASGKVEKAITVRGLGVTKGAKAAIEAAGGKVE
ncbi:MAG: 50S ribosomal protein L15 [Coxiellaceae bacterium]|nr:50S ribosomal protein L15 [Coxiellaceae bacterium]